MIDRLLPVRGEGHMSEAWLAHLSEQLELPQMEEEPHHRGHDHLLDIFLVVHFRHHDSVSEISHG